MSQQENQHNYVYRYIIKGCNKLEKEIKNIRDLQKQIGNNPDFQDEYDSYEQDILRLQAQKRTALRDAFRRKAEDNLDSIQKLIKTNRNTPKRAIAPQYKHTPTVNKTPITNINKISPGNLNLHKKS